MDPVNNSVINQYMALIRGEKDISEVGRPQAAPQPQRQIADAKPSKAPQLPTKGRFINIVV